MGPRPASQLSTIVFALLLAAILCAAAMVAATPASAGLLSDPLGSATSLRALVAAQQAQLAGADGAAGDSFGSTVAISGDTAVVGAPNDDIGANVDQGSVFIFVRSGTTWSQQEQLNAADGAADDCFGSCVAISGDTVVIGAHGDDVGANVDQGSVFIFVRSGTTWSQQEQLTVVDGAAGDAFGSAIAISSETVVVGASDDDVGANVDQGSAYVFVRSSTIWSQQAQLLAVGGSSGDSFGSAVAISGETALVGAPTVDVPPSSGAVHYDQGSAYGFRRSDTTWTQQAQLIASGGVGGDSFGCSVAMSGDMAVIGAEGSDGGSGSVTDQGAAYLFKSYSSSWDQRERLTATDGAVGDKLGSSVAIAGETVVAGTASRDVGASSDQGAAYVFAATHTLVGTSGYETTWSQQAKLTVTNGATDDAFGGSVAVSDNTAVVGACGTDIDGKADQGSAFVFTDVMFKPSKPVPGAPKGLIKSRTPTFWWTYSFRATGHEIRVYRGSRLIRKKTGDLTNQSWKCTRPLPRGVWLTWKVRAVNAAGWGVWSARPRFKIR